jgi:excinuclease ABC subunit C
MRGAKRKGVRYFGPYAHAWAIRETLDLLLRVFPARTCSAGVFKRPAQIGRPACSATSASARRRASGGSRPRSTGRSSTDFCDFMAGKTDR